MYLLGVGYVGPLLRECYRDKCWQILLAPLRISPALRRRNSIRRRYRLTELEELRIPAFRAYGGFGVGNRPPRPAQCGEIGFVPFAAARKEG
jgi:hypothetical protein